MSAGLTNPVSVSVRVLAEEPGDERGELVGVGQLPVPGGAPAHPALAVDAGLNIIGGPAGAGHGPGGGAGGRALRKLPGRARGLVGGGQLVRERRGGAQAKRFTVMADLYEEFVSRLARTSATLRPGDPADAATMLGAQSSRAGR
jgi:hypothetical protein